MTFSIRSAGRRILETPQISRNTALTVSEQLSAVSHLISSLELLTYGRDRDPGGLNDWEVARTRFERFPRFTRRVLDTISHPRNVRIVQGIRVASAASLLIPGTHRHLRAAANGVLTLTSAAGYISQSSGTDGTDQLTLIVQAASSVARIGERKPRLVDACLWSIAIQATMAYGISGYAKLPSEVWTSGEALTGVLRTESYGDEAAFKIAKKYPALAKAAAHTVLALECSFPIVFLTKGKLTLPMLSSMGTFHLINARVMGLGRFVWAFGGTYPAILYAVQSRAQTREIPTSGGFK